VKSDASNPKHDSLDAGFRAAGEFLHRVAHITSNPFATQALEGRDESPVDIQFVRRLRTIVDSILDDLTVRQRTIIERCDFGGEAREAVVADLGISIRHFQRERLEAHERIAARLRRNTQLISALTIPCTNGFDDQLRLSLVLENNGHAAEGASLLEKIAKNEGSADRRIDVELRLAQLYLSSERFALAQHHTNVARTFVDHLEPSQRWRDFAIEGVCMQILQSTGENERAAKLFQRCSVQLRSWTQRSESAKVALADILWWRALAEAGSNELEIAERLASEARALAMSTRVAAPYVQIMTRWLSVFIKRSRPSDIDTMLRESLRCYHDAISAGLTRTALYAAATVSVAYRIDSEPFKAIAFLTPLVGTARLVGPSEGARNVIEEFASANMTLGRFEEALVHLRDLERWGHTDPHADGAMFLLTSRAQLGLGDYAAALASSEKAEAIFTRIGRQRFVGHALLEQARALVGLHHYDRARRILPIVVDLAGAANEPKSLATTYRLMAIAADDPRYFSEAQRISRNLTS
jgi:tetratricopeptide (TPR) repeat protein